MWTYFIHETTTGIRRQQVKVTSGSFSTRMSDIGGGEHELVVADSGLNRAQWEELVHPWANTLVQCWNGRPVYAGLLVGWKVNRKIQTITVRHKELRLILNRRFPFRVGTRLQEGHWKVRDKSLRGVITELVRVGLARPDGGDGWNVPLGIPAGSEAGNSGTTLFNWDFTTVENGIAEVEDRDGGPDVHFDPRYVGAGQLEWELKIGNPRIGGLQFDYAMNVAEPRLFDVTSEADGTEMLTGVFTIGKGSEKDMRVGEAGLVQLPVRPKPIPFLDSSRPYKEVKDIPELNGHGIAELKRHGAPTVQWEMKTLTTGDVGADQLRLGSRIRQRYEGDWWEGTRTIDHYLIGMRGTHEFPLVLETQELGGL